LGIWGRVDWYMGTRVSKEHAYFKDSPCLTRNSVHSHFRTQESFFVTRIP